AARSMSPVEIAGTPRRAARSCAWVPFPAPGGPRRTIRAPSRRLPSSAAPPTDPSLLHEPLIVAHHELALDLLDRVHRDADHDEERRAAEVEVDPHALGEPVGERARDARTEPGETLHVEAGEQELGQH